MIIHRRQFVLVALRLEPRVRARSCAQRADVVVAGIELDVAFWRFFVSSLLLRVLLRLVLVRLGALVSPLGRLAGDRGAPRVGVVPGNRRTVVRVAGASRVVRPLVPRRTAKAHRRHLIPKDAAVRQQLVRGAQQVVQVVVRLRRVVRLLRSARLVQRAVAGGGVGVERVGPRDRALVRVLRVVCVAAGGADETRNQLGFGFLVPGQC